MSLTPTDLLDDDGNIKVSAIKSRTQGKATEIDAETCDRFRRKIGDGRAANEVAREEGVGKSTVRRHIKGECWHLDGELTEPPLSYSRAGGWEQADEEENQTE